MKAIFFTSGGIHVATMLGMARAYDLSDVDIVGGISAGAILSSFVGAYDDPQEGLNKLESIILTQHLQPSHNIFNIFRSVLFGKSLYRDNFSKILDTSLPSVKRKILIGATDETNINYSLFEFDKGSKLDSTNSIGLHEACSASLSVPGVFPGVDVGNKHYIDGGYFHTIPVEGIEKAINLAKESGEELELVLFSAAPWGWAPRKKKHHIFQIPHELMRLLESFNSANLYNDRRMLHKLIETSDNVKLSIFMLPAKVVNDIYIKYPPSSYAKCKPETFSMLIDEGYNLVKTVLEHST